MVRRPWLLVGNVLVRRSRGKWTQLRESPWTQHIIDPLACSFLEACYCWHLIKCQNFFFFFSKEKENRKVTDLICKHNTGDYFKIVWSHTRNNCVCHEWQFPTQCWASRKSNEDERTKQTYGHGSDMGMDHCKHKIQHKTDFFLLFFTSRNVKRWTRFLFGFDETTIISWKQQRGAKQQLHG